MKEEAIESLLFNHPYLLDASFDCANRMQRQFTYPGGRIDIVFQDDSGLILVEVKRTCLVPAHFDQLMHYIDDLSTEQRLSNRHYLVGKTSVGVPTEITAPRGYTIRLRLVGREIPHRLRFDAATSRYVPARRRDRAGVYTLRL